MLYKGKEIGIPTLEQVEECIKEEELDLDANSIYKKYSKRNWLTKKGTPIKCLECVLNACHGVKVGHMFYNKKKRKEKVKNEIERLKSLMDTGNPSEEDRHDTYIIYKEQLTDKRWLAFRDFVLTVRGCVCENCKNTTNLNIHHLKYIPKRLAWEYTVNEVRVLCYKCHKKVHNIK